MAEETNEVMTQTEEPQGEPEAKETDWKAEARKWEARAKKSLAAEEELEKLKAAQMTEQEKAIARAETAEAELARLKAEKAKAEKAKEIAEKNGVPVSLLSYCADEEAMEAFAAEYAKSQAQVHAAPMSNGSRIIRGNEQKPTTREQFAHALEAAGL